MGTEFFDELGETLSRTAKGISEKAETIYETQKIRNKIAAEERAADKVLTEIGGLLYKRYREGEEFDGELTDLFARVSGHRDAVREYKKQLAGRKGKKICPSCQKEVDREVAYCPYCGSPCPAEEEETGEEIPEEEGVSTGEEASQPETGKEDSPSETEEGAASPEDGEGAASPEDEEGAASPEDEEEVSSPEDEEKVSSSETEEGDPEVKNGEIPE